MKRGRVIGREGDEEEVVVRERRKGGWISGRSKHPCTYALIVYMYVNGRHIPYK